MSMQRIIAVLASLALGVIVALAVPAGSFSAPPALDQYVETLPGAGGDKPSQNGRNGGGSGGGSGDGGGGGLTVSASELEALQGSGEDGAAAAEAVAATAPRVDRNGGEGKNGRAGGDGFAGDELEAFADSGETPVSAVFSALAGSGSGGVVLPIVLLAALLAGVAIAARRRSIGR